MILKKKVWDGYFILYLLSRLNKFLNGFSIQRNRLNNNLAYWDLTWERNKKISLFIKRTSYYCLGVYSKSLELKIVDIRTLLEPTVVTHTCDPSIWENWCRRILSSSPTWTVVWNLIFKKKILLICLLWVWNIFLLWLPAPKLASCVLWVEHN